ncbi:ATP-binding protein [Corynebacterium sp. Q4381]|uniref:ATP-binding protein n=1 Tax=Corynebacterium sp. Marseille-Q4381 TaxID=3121597 RepID=UPI002FE66DCC
MNPFVPTFGVSPAILGGRDALTSGFGASLEAGPGDPRRTLLISGPRGIGKTVLLNELEDEAARRGWMHVRAQPYDLIQPLVDTEIPRALQRLRQSNPNRRKVTGVSVAGLGGFSTSAAEGAEPAPSLTSALHELCDALPGPSGVLITLDEVQSVDQTDLWHLTAAVQDLRRDNRNIAFAAAGLPEGVARLLQHPGTTFLRRAQHAVLAPMTPAETASVLQTTAAAGGLDLEGDALNEAVGFTRGYPFLVQLLGYHVFQRVSASSTKASVDDIIAVRGTVLDSLGQLVHDPALSPVPAGERAYLAAMAEIQRGQEAVASADIARHMGKRTQELSVVRDRLIRRELIYSPRRGYLNFLIPYLGRHLTGSGTRDLGWD